MAMQLFSFSSFCPTKPLLERNCFFFCPFSRLVVVVQLLLCYLVLRLSGTDDAVGATGGGGTIGRPRQRRRQHQRACEGNITLRKVTACGLKSRALIYFVRSRCWLCWVGFACPGLVLNEEHKHHKKRAASASISIDFWVLAIFSSPPLFPRHVALSLCRSIVMSFRAHACVHGTHTPCVERLRRWAGP